MRRMLVLFVLSVLALVARPETVKAQGWLGGGEWINMDAVVAQQRAASFYRQQGLYNQYGWYDPAYLQQMMSLPEGLAACSVDFSTGRVVSCRPIVKEVSAIQGYLQNPEGLLGTVHVEKGKLHFRPFDDTNQRLGRGGATAIGTAGGAVAGGVFGGKKGAVIGGGTGALAGWLASRKFNRHDNCLIIEPTVAQSAGLSPNEVEVAPVSHQEQAPTPTRPTPQVPVDPLTNITWQTVNTTKLRAVVTDPNTGEKKLIPAWGSMSLRDPVGDQPYTVVLLDPGQGKSIPVPGEIRPSQDLQGWEIVAR